MEALSFPFRFKGNSAVVLNTTDEAYSAQKVASVVSTSKGELPFLPLFGVEDAEFGDFDSAGLVYSCSNSFTDISIKDILLSTTEDGRVLVDVQFDII